MANLQFTRPGGVWNSDTDLLPGELADIDAKTVRAISGDGGVYVLEDDLVIGGSSHTFEVSPTTEFLGEVTCFADMICASDTFLNGPVYVYGQSGFYANAYFNQDAEFFENVIIHGGQLYMEAGSQLFQYGTTGFYDNVYFEAGSDPEFNAPVAINSGLTVNGPLIANGVTVLGDPTHVVQLRGPTDLQKTLTMSSGGSIAHRVVAGNDTTTTFSPLAVHEVILEAGVLTGSTDWYIDDTGCTNGNEILFTNKDGAAAVDVRRPGGSKITTLTAEWVRCVRVGGVWQGSQGGAVPT